MSATSQELGKALEALKEALDFAHKSQNESVVYKIARDACIQRFEFCVELSWKVSAKFMGSAAMTAKVVVREMAQAGLISSPDVWFGFIEARNRSSHTYDEEQAVIVFNVITQFLPEAESLFQKLK